MRATLHILSLLALPALLILTLAVTLSVGTAQNPTCFG